MHRRRRLCAALASGALIACQAPPRLVPDPLAPVDCADASEVSHSVFLVGGAGAPRLPDHVEARLPVDPVLLALRSDVLEQVGALGVDRVAVLYLGDNVHPHGLVPDGRGGRARGERVLRMLIRASDPARVVFTAGDRDWSLPEAEGWENVRAQAEFLAGRSERVAMLPPGGCSGPASVDFGDHLRIVLVDPVGLAHARDHPASHAAACGHPTADDALRALAGEFEASDGRHRVLAMHRATIAAEDPGKGAGPERRLTASTALAPWRWLSRERVASEADAADEAQRSAIEAIVGATRPGVPLLFASGHERSLQLHRDEAGAYHAMSGGGSASDVVRVEPTSSALLALSAPGYMRLDAHADGALGLTVLAVLEGEHGEPLLRQCLAHGPAPGRVR